MTTTSEQGVLDDTDLNWLSEDLTQLNDIPETNDAFTTVIKAAATLDDDYVEILHQEGGVYSYECFLDVFNMKYEKLIGLFGAKIMSKKMAGISTICLPHVHFL